MTCRNLNLNIFSPADSRKSKHPRAMAVQRQEMALQNSENMVEVANRDVTLHEKYFNQKLYLQAKHIRSQKKMIANRLIYFW